MQVLVTGGAGYIGSHAVVELLDAGYEVVVFDNLENGDIKLVDKRAKFFKGDVRDKNDLRKLFSENDIKVVMHFAGYIRVDESMVDPNKYYGNNTFGTLNLIEVMKEFKIKNIVFSSTAAVYGEIKTDELVTEDFKVNPINPYGKSKLMAEEIIKDSDIIGDLNYSIFRYFNVVGAHEKYSIGQNPDKVTALLSKIMDAAIDKNKIVKILGDDYPTKDGTGVRDYIHVTDLVKAHILSIKKLLENKSGTYNLGNGNGFSVYEMISAAKKVTGQEIGYEIVNRRLGDPAKVIASSKKAKEELNWEPNYKEIEKIIETTWNWRNV